MPVKLLNWDSAFFGYSVASASFDTALPDATGVQAAIQAARGLHVRLLCLFLPPLDTALRRNIERIGATPVGRRREYAKPVRRSPPPDSAGDIAWRRENHPRLIELALQSGRYSRFRIDNGFKNGEFERLYREWLATSLRGENGKRTYVAGKPDEPYGLLTLEPAEVVARIGLLAVDMRRRGQGIGRRLVETAERFCIQNNIVELSVATQADNRNACRFYERYGFRKISETECWHVWLPSAMLNQAQPLRKVACSPSLSTSLS